MGLLNWFKKDAQKPAALETAEKQAEAQPLTPKPGSITRESTMLRTGLLGEVLLKYNIVSRENLDKALTIQQQLQKSGKRKLLGEILMEERIVTEEELLSAMARHCKIPYIKINKYGLSREAINSVPLDIVLKHKVFPTDKIGQVIILAVIDPYNTSVIEEIKSKTNLRVKTVLCRQSEFWDIVRFYYPNLPTEATAQAGLLADALSGQMAQSAELGGETSAGSAEPAAEPPSEKSPEPTRPNIPIKTDEVKIAGSVEVAETAPDTIKETKPSQPENQTTQILPETTTPNDIIAVNEIPFPEPPVFIPKPSKTDSGIETTRATAQEPEQIISPAPADQTGIITIDDLTPDEELEENTMPEIRFRPIEITREEVIPAPQEISPLPRAITPEVRNKSSESQRSPDNFGTVPEKTPPVAPLDATSETITQPQTSRRGGNVPPEIITPTPSISSGDKESQPEPTTQPDKKQAETDYPVIVSEEEFTVSVHLIQNQIDNLWKKRYHRISPVYAEKVDENEFVFHTVPK